MSENQSSQPSDSLSEVVQSEAASEANQYDSWDSVELPVESPPLETASEAIEDDTSAQSTEPVSEQMTLSSLVNESAVDELAVDASNIDALATDESAMDESAVNEPASQPIPPLTQSTEESWSPVELPGTVDMMTTNPELSNASRVATALGHIPKGATTDSAEVPFSEGGLKDQRETELLTLIHDLNECNDVLLGRVSQLETTIETQQKQIKAESAQSQLAQDKLTERVSAEQASAHQASQKCSAAGR